MLKKLKICDDNMMNNDITTDRGWRNLIKNNKFPLIKIESANDIWKGNKTDRTFKSTNLLSDYLNIPLFFADDKYCYGILRINSIIKEEDNSSYIYNFDILSKFEDPKPVVIDDNKKEGEIVENTKFLAEMEVEEENGLHPFWIYKKVKKEDKIENIDDETMNMDILNKIILYNPSKLSDKKLYEDYKTINAWYSISKLNKHKIPLNIILYLAKKIYKEVDKRKLLYKIDNKKELFELINNNKSIKLI